MSRTRSFSLERFPSGVRERQFELLIASARYLEQSSKPERIRLTQTANKIRLFAGRLIVMTASRPGLLWLATAPGVMRNIEHGLSSWHRDTEQSRPESALGHPYPKYKRPESINGFYVITEDTTGRDWKLLHDAHLAYLDLAIEQGAAPDPRTKHEPELLEQLKAMFPLQDAVLVEDKARDTDLTTALSKLPVHGIGASGVLEGRLVELERQEEAQEFAPSAVQDRRERALASIVRRRGQPSFREGLLKRYARTCLVTGCQTPEVLEAAHIIPYLGDETNHLSNGLPLRSDIHTLFDLGLLSIDENALKVVLAPRLRDSEYGRYHGQRLRLQADNVTPSQEALHRHRIWSGIDEWEDEP
ncbi:HNH endonuclease [Haliangium ochraceum]|uniref:HNH nuclease domain-containing protein n=1 Tax=Haliangium ochraceum (strain DSM 14365 / JCM 11303 / SMP-2) TaxID=502025 RepID=D0LN05_HALO1|nr:HNH endonuclease [Haliangium ochraceum]ACY13376.1 hypothetical protein Hoch_0757 [Haliangium ochraceum DSM 14365]